MRTSKVLLLLLLVASLAVDLALVRSVSARAVWPNGPAAVALGLAGGQINLATVWGLLGYRHLPWRVAVLLLVPLGWATAIALSAPKIQPGYHVAATWGVHFLTQTILLAAVLIPIRLRGAVLQFGTLAPDPPSRRRQFTLRHLFAWITSTAISLSVLKTAFERAKLKETDFDWGGILILGLVAAMIGLTSMWPILDTRDRTKRTAATLFTASPVLSIVGVMLFFVDDAQILLAVLLLWLVVAVYSGVALGVLKVAGFRLVWLSTGMADTSSARNSNPPGR